MFQIVEVVRFSRWGIVAATVLAVTVMTMMVAPSLLISEKLFDDLSFIVPIMLWNIAPLATGYFLLERAEFRAGWASIAFAIGVIGSTLYIHGWFLLVMLGLVRGSSTGVLGLFFLPAYQIVLASIMGTSVFIFVVVKNHFFTK